MSFRFWFRIWEKPQPLSKQLVDPQCLGSSIHRNVIELWTLIIAKTPTSEACRIFVGFGSEFYRHPPSVGPRSGSACVPPGLLACSVALCPGCSTKIFLEPPLPSSMYPLNREAEGPKFGLGA